MVSHELSLLHKQGFPQTNAAVASDGDFSGDYTSEPFYAFSRDKLEGPYNALCWKFNRLFTTSRFSVLAFCALEKARYVFLTNRCHG